MGMSMRWLFIALLCMTAQGCIVDVADGVYALTTGRHIDDGWYGGNMAVLGPGGSVAAGTAADKNKKNGPGGQTNASSGAAGALRSLTDKAAQNAFAGGGLASPAASVGALTAGAQQGIDKLGGQGGKSAGAGTNALLRPPPVRPGLTDGTVPGYGPDSPASAGQVVSALGLAAGITNPLGLAAGAASEDQTNRTLLGRSVDSLFGGKPGTPVQTRNPIANNTNTRGDVQQSQDGVLADRAGRSAAAALTGDAPQTGTDALFSDVTLADRRKPKSSLAGTQMLMKAVA